MLTYATRTLSNSIRRPGGSRKERYLPIPVVEDVSQHRLIRSYFDHFVKGKDLDSDTRKYFSECYKNQPEAEAEKGLIALYDDQYVICFLGAENLCCCGMKITHNDNEKEIFRAFMSGSTKVAFKSFQQLCLRLLKEKQRIRILKNLPVVGVLYSSYPEEDIEIKTGFMRYMNRVKALELADSKSVEFISEAIERGCTLEEIDAILPQDPEARFMSRKLDDIEYSQIEFLNPKSAVNA